MAKTSVHTHTRLSRTYVALARLSCLVLICNLYKTLYEFFGTLHIP